MSKAYQRQKARGAMFGIAAAILFGLSAPAAKLLLPRLEPLMLAALLYLGAGAGLTIYRLVRPTAEAPIRRSDWPTLAVITIAGGIIGPVLMLYGLLSVSAAVGSLLLNLEAPFTILLAILLFREHLDRRELAATGIIVLGSIAVSFEPEQLRGGFLGSLCIAGACLAWGIDNNLTQRLSIKDPVALVRVKTVGAGTCTLLLALLLGQRVSGIGAPVGALVLGLFSYGMSVLFDAYALRLLGAAREAAFFATAPFVGAALSFALLGDRLSVLQLAGAAIMVTGVIALLRARHSHVHAHEAMEHEHRHIHDEHHQHEHGPEVPPGEPHSHRHRHEPITHQHPHASDIHHRHRAED